jgi:hypothetical protein
MDLNINNDNNHNNNDDNNNDDNNNNHNNNDDNNNDDNNNENNCKVINFYWGHITQIISNIDFFCIENKFQNILEISPCNVPFSLSTKTIGFNETIKDFI